MAEHSASSPVVSLLAVSSEWEARLTAALQEIGLTTSRYSLLAHLQASPGVSFSELARQLHITVQSAHSAARSLVTAGFIADSTAHAGSASQLAVTAAGAEALRRAEVIVGALDVELAAAFPELGAALRGAHERGGAGHPPH